MIWLEIGLAATGVLIMIILVLYLSTVRIQIHLKVKGLDVNLDVQVFLWRIRILKFKVPDLKLKKDPLEVVIEHESSITKEKSTDLEADEAEPFFKQIKVILELLKERKQLHHLLHIKELKWESAVGCEEADWTAYIVGLIWTLKSVGLKMVQKIVDLQPLQLNVVPVFNKWYFESHLSCMISFRLGKAITQALWIRKQLKRRRLLHGRPSHSRTHEDSA